MRVLPETGGGRAGAEGLWNAWKRSRRAVALAVVMTLVAYWWFTMIANGPTDWGFDFHQFWQGGNDVVDGVSPYPTADDVTAADTRSAQRDPGRVPLPLPGWSSGRDRAVRRADFDVAAAILGCC